MYQEMLYSSLGPNIAALAQPKMLEGGEVVWHSFSNDDKGDKGMVRYACKRQYH